MFAQNFPKEKWFNADEPFKKSGSSTKHKTSDIVKIGNRKKPKICNEGYIVRLKTNNDFEFMGEEEEEFDDEEIYENTKNADAQETFEKR